MSENIVVALIGTIPGTLTAIVTLVTLRSSRAPVQGAPRDEAPAGPGPEPPAPSAPRPSRARTSGVLGMAVVVLASAVVTASLALGGLYTYRAVADDDKQLVVDRTVTVPGTQVWTDTGIDLQAGDEVVITASGEVVHDTGSQNGAGPDGDAGLRFPSNVLGTSDHGSLLGKIGENGDPFHVGAAGDVDARGAGRLFLGVNDIGVDNNAGEFTARVEVRR